MKFHFGFDFSKKIAKSTDLVTVLTEGLTLTEEDKQNSFLLSFLQSSKNVEQHQLVLCAKTIINVSLTFDGDRHVVAKEKISP